MNHPLADLTTAGDPTRTRGGNDRLRFLPALTIIAHPYAERTGQSCFLRRKGTTELTRLEPDFTEVGATFGEGLGDPFVSRKPILLTPHHGGVIIDNTQVGKRLSINGTPWPESVTLSANELDRGVVLNLAGRVCLLLHKRAFTNDHRTGRSSLIGNSDAVRTLREQIAKVADLSTPVVLLGASGTGKELVASAIAAGHKGPFVKVNMAAIPANLAASELFGTVRGAFTGAERDRPGFFASADGGTLFLDEIGEIPQEVQPLLLRALESGEIQAVGAREIRKVSVRVIAATDSNLDDLVAKGKFKAPLLHRLAGFVIRMPTLAERREDIGMLFTHFARAALAETKEAHLLAPDDPHAKPWLPADLAEALLAFDWPGNVRQLRNLVNQLVINHRGAPNLTLDAATRALLQPAPGEATRGKRAESLTEQEISEALRANRFDIKATAADLGISRTALYRKIERIPSIRKASDLTRDELTEAHQAHAGNLEAMAEALEVSVASLRRRMGERGGNPG